MDGVRRYVEELLFGLGAFQLRQPDKWRIDVLTAGEIVPILQYIQRMETRREEERREFGAKSPEVQTMDKKLLAFKEQLKAILPGIIYDSLSPVYRALPIRKILRWMRGDTMQEKYLKAWKEAGKNHQVIHVPLPQHYYFVSKLSLPFVFTVHDLTHKLFPEYHEPENIKLTEKGMQFIVEKANAIIAVSESTRQDMLKDYLIDLDKMFVVYEAANADRFNPKRDVVKWEEIRSRYALPDGPYLISLSTIEPRKNLRNVIAAFLLLCEDPDCAELNLVICGRKGWKHEDLIHTDHPFSHRIYFTGHVMDDDLPWLYSYATGLCYLAHYEGFGLPPLEAMRCGTPVVYGNNSSLSEIIDDAGLPADSTDVEAISAQFKKLYLDKSLQEKLVKNAHQRALRFSWLKTAFETLIVYEQTIKFQNIEGLKDGIAFPKPQTLHI